MYALLGGGVLLLPALVYLFRTFAEVERASTTTIPEP
jgi:hypothetical protein